MSKLNNKEGDMPHNIKSNKRIAVTHGELCLKPVSRLPRGERTSHTMYIAAHSQSGHNHVIEGDLDVVTTKNNKRYLLIKEVSKLFHDKTFDVHETRELAPGFYEVTERTEYNPWTKVVQRVFD